MSKDPLSSSYAGALIELASDRGDLEAVNEEVGAFLTVLRDNPDFRVFLMTPSVDPAEKNKVLDAAFSGKVSATLLDFIELVLTKRRQLFLEDMLEEFQALFEEKMVLSDAGVQVFVRQDQDATTKVQYGLNSRFAPRGRYSWQEESHVQFNRWLTQRYQAAWNGRGGGAA